MEHVIQLHSSLILICEVILLLYSCYLIVFINSFSVCLCALVKFFSCCQLIPLSSSFVWLFCMTCEFYIFVCFYYSKCQPFFCMFRTPLSISCRTGLLVMNYLNVCLSGKDFIYSSFVKLNLDEHKILDLQEFLLLFVFFSTLKIPPHSFLTYEVSAEKSSVGVSFIGDWMLFSYWL